MLFNCIQHCTNPLLYSIITSPISCRSSVTVFNNGCKLLFSRRFSRFPRTWLRTKRKDSSDDNAFICSKSIVPSHIPHPDYAATGIVSKRSDKIQIFEEDEIIHMRESCSLARMVLETVGKHVEIGISTSDLDKIAHETCIKHGAYPSPLNYRGFPKSICTSLNSVACHGIPNHDKLKDGDIISIDVSVFYKGYHGDCASTFSVGNVDTDGQTLVQVASLCLHEAIQICRSNQNFSAIGKTINKIAKSHGFCVIPAFCGHGIGTNFHCPPNILHYDNNERGQMHEGMIFTIEPVIGEGDHNIVILEDGWTAVTEDESRSAQFEHTILITKDGAEILTLLNNS